MPLAVIVVVIKCFHEIHPRHFEIRILSENVKWLRLIKIGITGKTARAVGKVSKRTNPSTKNKPFPMLSETNEEID